MNNRLVIVVLALLLFTFLYYQNEEELIKEATTWPAQSEWDNLKKNVGGRLTQVEIPLYKMENDPPALDNFLKRLENPFNIQEYPWGTQTTGWLNAWSTQASSYAIAAEKVSDIVAGVNFAKEHRLKLVVKGAGHDYLGRSEAPHSLLIWTHRMQNVSIHDSFVPSGAPAEKAGKHAVTVGAGSRWVDVYHEVTTKNHRYVQGGGCTTVGAAGGFIQGGGFGSFSKKYGIAASSLIEAEVVLANGEVVIANEYQHPDLLWALKGGGGGTFGIVTKATMETHELPNFFGIVQGKVTAKTEKEQLDLIEQFIHFYRDNLNNEHWGEQAIFHPDNSIDLLFLSQGLNKEEIEKVWSTFQKWVLEKPDSYTINLDYTLIPAKQFWNYEYLAEHHPDLVMPASPDNQEQFYWAPNQNEVLSYIFSYQSRWLPMALFEQEASKKLAQTLFDASRHWKVSLHFNKGLAGAPADALKRSKETPMNPVVLDSAALIIINAREQYVFKGLKGHEPNIKKGSEDLEKINAAMSIITRATPDSGAYSNEADYFQPNWQQAFWGEHYSRLLEIKKKYDPEGLFECHHSVGSELKTIPSLQ